MGQASDRRKMPRNIRPVDIGGVIEITFDAPFMTGFKVHGPADEDRYTKRHIETREKAVQEADLLAQAKANELGEKVAVTSYIDHDPIRSEVNPE